MAVNVHLEGDIVYYLGFLCGQLLFVLRRAAAAIRSKTNPTSTRIHYIQSNWDLLLIRMALEIPAFYLFRHYSLNTILGLFSIAWKAPLQVPQNALTFFMLGYLADSLLDWFGLSKFAPDWLKENIPDMQVYSLHTVEQSENPDTGASVKVDKTVTVQKPTTAPPEDKGASDTQ